MNETMFEHLIREIVAVRNDGKDPVDCAMNFLKAHEGKRVRRIDPQVHRLVARGMREMGATTGEIANHLGISERYVFKLIRKNEQKHNSSSVTYKGSME